jgi:pyruvate dehydrogenase E2 component (dihydrolipoamide acetyltransferase)
MEMVFQFRFPDVGEGITEGTIVKWKVKVGDTVKKDQSIAEIETDKAVVEIPCPKPGKISSIFHKEGEKINVGDVLVEIDDGSPALPTKQPSAVPKEAAGKPARAQDEPPKKKDEKYTGSVVGFLEEAKEVTKRVDGKHKEAGAKIKAAPKIRALAKKKGISLSSVRGTGPGGRITEKDLSAGQAAKSESLSGVRKAIARNLMDSHLKTAHATNFHDADVTNLWDIRALEKVKAAKQGVKLTFMPYVVQAVVKALKKYPIVNSRLEVDDVISNLSYHLGIATDTDAGLLVPVLKDADKKSLYDLAKEMEELSDKARGRKLDMSQLRGSTFTITNLGSIGVKYFTPLINYPEVAILGLGRIEERPAAIDGKIAIRKFLPLSFTYDHRLVDGADASRFMLEVITQLEAWK